MFSFFSRKSTTTAPTTSSQNSLLTTEAASFLDTFSETPSTSTDSLKENSKPEVEEQTKPSFDSTVTRIVNDFKRMQAEKTFKQMRWKIPQGVGAASVARKCSGKCGAKFIVEKVGTLEYVSVMF